MNVLHTMFWRMIACLASKDLNLANEFREHPPSDCNILCSARLTSWCKELDAIRIAQRLRGVGTSRHGTTGIKGRASQMSRISKP